MSHESILERKKGNTLFCFVHGDIFYSVVAETMSFLSPNRNKPPHLSKKSAKNLCRKKILDSVPAKKEEKEEGWVYFCNTDPSRPARPKHRSRPATKTHGWVSPAVGLLKPNESIFAPVGHGRERRQ
jgi:hypothetical protein